MLLALSNLMLVAANVTGEPLSSIVLEPVVVASFKVDVELVTLMPLPPERVAEIFASPPDCPCNTAVTILRVAPLVTV